MTTAAHTEYFHLPDVGEGLTEAQITAWLVAVGDTVELNDVIAEIETAKSIVELPSPFAGRVVELCAALGDTLAVGSPLLAIVTGHPTGGADPSTPIPSEPPTPPTIEPTRSTAPAALDAVEHPLVLVGSGTRAAAARRIHLTRPVNGAEIPVRHCPAQPVRGERREPIRGVRKAVAAAMTRSAFTAPHATEWVTTDVTSTMDLIRRLRSDRNWSDVRITPLLLVAKALLLAIHRHPEINATWDEECQEIVVKDYVNLGIAVASERGLIVPNVKDAQTLDLRALATALQQLVETARSGRTQPEEMARGTVTITNIGAFGIDGGTPILNPGESAILAVGQIRKTPWVVADRIVVRETATLAISFDHRVVDGELGARVLDTVASILGDPGTALLL